MKWIVPVFLALVLGISATALIAQITQPPGGITGNINNLPSSTVAGLPTCTASLSGALRMVTDATTPTYNAALTGGSNVIVPVFCNGSAWTSH